MLKPEEAQKELAKLQQADCVEVRLRGLSKLPATARTFAVTELLSGTAYASSQVQDRLFQGA
jgi:hypothetical protein